MTRASTPVSGSGGLGMTAAYNHDLHVGSEFASSYPDITEALVDERLWKMFTIYELLAKKHKESFQNLGLWSLILGSLPLLMAALRLALGEGKFAHLTTAALFTGLSGAASVVLMLVLRRRRSKILWCQSVFCRERLRQWHFQQFLDGNFICLIKTDPKAYQKERDLRWNDLVQNLQDGYGLMLQFASYSSKEINNFVSPSEYPDEQVARSVFSAMHVLRFEHQLRYSTRKRGEEGEPSGLALSERENISESVASMALAGAVCTTALAMLVSFSDLSKLEFVRALFPEGTGRVLDGLAVGLAVLSASSRAYRSGFTLPDESESYEEYSDRLREAKAVFLMSNDSKTKLHQLEIAEEEATAELRRFLRLKIRATFIS